MPSMLSGMSRAFIRPGMIGGNRREMSADTLGRLKLRASIRGNFFDRPKVAKMIGKMNAKVLSNLGYDIKQAAQKGIGQSPPKTSAAARQRMGRGKPVEFVGGLYLDITTYGSGQPRAAGKPVKSWAPRRWFYYDIRDYFDPARITAVIGTEKTAPWMAQLHQFGGTVKQTAWRIGVGAARNAYLRKRGNGRQGRDERGRYTSSLPQANQYEYGALIWQIDKAGRFKNSRNWERTTITRMARYPARPFMAGSKRVDAAVAKANEKWRNMLARN
jgi:phage gpG-like protein